MRTAQRAFIKTAVNDDTKTNPKRFWSYKKLASQESSHSEETLVKTIFSRDKKESSALEVNPSYDQKLSKVKTKTNKKIVYTKTDEQLSAHKARIIMLEEQNRDYENTITLLQRKLNSNNIASENKVYEQNIYSEKNRLSQFETIIISTLDILKIEIQHKFTIHNMKHHLEVSELKAKVDLLYLTNSTSLSKNKSNPTPVVKNNGKQKNQQSSGNLDKEREKRKEILMIGSSNTKYISAKYLSFGSANVNKIIKYKIQECMEYIGTIDDPNVNYDAIILHILGNDIEHKTPKECIALFQTLIDQIRKKK
ncbi:unnamed protein product [Mytilus coruscus]|uniref:Uncharacterized protein n=1 Tax=Mytilus coruscus TaxID=42192 RepID=A0A6J8A170_MYTCO|nr:unnamed protein product [Mytilus coruscus]